MQAPDIFGPRPREFFALRDFAQRHQFRNRVIAVPVNPPQWADRIRQSYERLESGGGRTLQSVRRDPLTGAQIVKCDPQCVYPPCVQGRKIIRSFTGQDNARCAGCLECTLMSDE